MIGNNIKYYNELLEDDLLYILENTKNIWESFKNKTIFITGGTGFFGKWLLETFAFVNLRLDLNIKIVVLSRSPEKFLNEFDYIKNNSVFKFIKGDIRNYDFPQEHIDYIIHAATEASVKLNNEDPILMFDTIIEGTRRTLEFAKKKQIKSFLFVSSGAVYGKQPSEMTHIPEDYIGAPDCLNPESAYGEGKRAAEMLCTLYFKQYEVPVKIARCFAFVGPYLPLDSHFAIGNFLLNELQGEDIIINGDGTPYRSYLYSTDLIIWLLTILFSGQNNVAYNIGSNEYYTLREIANEVQQNNTCFKIKILKGYNTNQPIERYVPNIYRTVNEFGFKSITDLKSAISKTMKFYSKILKGKPNHD